MKHIRQSRSHLCLISLLYCLCGLVFAEVSKTTNKETGLLAWKLKQGKLELELIQRLPDQTRAFFLGRGFSTRIANDLGRSCIFQTIFRNTDTNESGTSTVLSVDLKDWRVNQAGVSRTLKLKEVWEHSWSDEAVSPSARLAFRWATFPTTQTFQAGDYSWGMLSFGLLPATHFDLQLVWKVNGKKQIAKIEKLSCAEDR